MKIEVTKENLKGLDFPYPSFESGDFKYVAQWAEIGQRWELFMIIEEGVESEYIGTFVQHKGEGIYVPVRNNGDLAMSSGLVSQLAVLLASVEIKEPVE